MRTSRFLWALLAVCLLFAVSVAAAGTISEQWRSPVGMFSPRALAVNATDGSVWVADYDAGSVIHISRDGAELLRKTGLAGAIGLSVNSADGSVWVLAYGAGEVVHLASTGVELWRGGGFGGFMMASADPADGSVWLGGPAKLVHLTAAGAEIGRYTHPSGYVALPSVDPRDGSCWASIVATTSVVHVASDGALLWHTDAMPGSGSVSVNPTDGSCWICGGTTVGSAYVSTVVHLAADGSQLWRRDGWWTPDGGPWVAVNPKDGSCWVLNNILVTPHQAGLTLVGVDGKVRAQHPIPDQWIADMAADAGDGSLWVAIQTGVVVHLVADPGASPFWDIGADHWAVDEITACADAGIVAGYPDGNYHPATTVTRDQMAVYIARALTGSDASVPTGPSTPSFADVPLGSWAFDYVEYAKDQNIVTGYPDGSYGPAGPVTRDQMAVYVSRAIADPIGEAGLAGYTPPATPSFPDVQTNSWAFKYVEYAKQAGVVKGYADGTYHPGDAVTRDQMAAYVARAFQLVP